MKTAIDSNVISSIWSNEPTARTLVEKLNQARSSGSLVIAPVVFAELHAHPRVDLARMAQLLESAEIEVDFDGQEAVWREAGLRFARYAARRRQATGAEPRDILADYFIGAHALLQADCLVTTDKRVYRVDFPELMLV